MTVRWLLSLNRGMSFRYWQKGLVIGKMEAVRVISCIKILNLVLKILERFITGYLAVFSDGRRKRGRYRHNGQFFSILFCLLSSAFCLLSCNSVPILPLHSLLEYYAVIFLLMPPHPDQIYTAGQGI